MLFFVHRWMLRFIVLWFLVVLTGCQKVYQTHYDYSPPNFSRGQQCIEQCALTRDQCYDNCGPDLSTCQARVANEARRAYERYVLEQETLEKPIARDLNSFNNPLQCAQEACQCDRDYRACYELCGGRIHKTEVCIKNCK